MKKVLLTSVLALLVTAGSTMKAQDRADEYLGLPGDNLNLYAVMNLFQESETLEDFERNLNDENSRINNLDLNGDNYVDYISVNDYANGNVHTIVMQVSLNSSERQDVGVFTVERLRDNAVQIQLIGDEALYGRNYIIEPYYAETPNPGYTGRARGRAAGTAYVEISAWPVVRYIYQPQYVVWRSSWYWGYYPHWYNTWSPFYYHHYYGYHSHFYDHYYTHYRHWDTPRWSGYHNNYYSRVRIASPLVVININKGNYKHTYSRPESRRDGEALYARTQSTRNSTLTNGSTRRTTATESTSRTREAAGTTTRRAENTTVSRSNNARTSTPATTRNASERASAPNRSVSRTTPAGRSAAERPANSDRSTSARTSTPANRSVATRSTSPAARPSASENRSVATRSSNSSARPASSENRSVSARTSTAPRNTETRSSAPSQSREVTTRSSSASQNRSTSARSSSAPRQQSASAPKSASRQSAPAARSSSRSNSKSVSTRAASSSSSSRKSEESKSRR